MNGSQRPNFERAIRAGALTGVLGMAVSLRVSVIHPDQFFRSYLLAFVFWLGFTLGSMAILMMHHLTGGEWGLPIRRPLEAATRTVPLMLILFLPLIFALKRLFPWAQPGGLGDDPILKFKRMYLSLNFFMTRALIYFVIWFTLSYFLNKWSEEQDRTGNPATAKWLEGMSGPGLILWGLAITYAMIDWVMSLQPHWFSTIFGMIFMMVGAVGAMSLVILTTRTLSNYEPVSHVVTPDQFNDLGNLLLAFVMLWAYLSFSQFLIIWSGNLPKEISWYMVRANGQWAAIAVFLIIFHFAIPFLLLLQRNLKRRVQRLAVIAGALIVISAVDVYWLVVPAFEPAGPRVHPMDLTLLVGIGGLWIATYAWQLKRRPLLPLHDPRFEGALEHGD